MILFNCLFLMAWGPLAAVPESSPSLATQPTDPKEAISAIEKLRGKIQREGGKPAGAVVGVHLGILRENCAVENIACLRQFKNLRSLKLTGFCVEDAHLEIVSQLKSLEFLEVFQAEIGDKGVRSLGKLYKLKELRLVLCPRVTDEGVKGLKNLRRLERLALQDTKATGNCFKDFECKKVLKDLELRRSDFTDEGLRNLKGFTQLECLDLSSNYGVTDKGLMFLTGLPKLRAVGLDSTQVTPEGGAAFRRARPDVDAPR